MPGNTLIVSQFACGGRARVRFRHRLSHFPPADRLRRHRMNGITSPSPTVYSGASPHRSTTMNPSRRHFLASAAVLPLAVSAATADDAPTPARPNRIGVSTYSFWQFRNKELRDVEKCIETAADMGFDGVEILHRQMEIGRASCRERVEIRVDDETTKR